MRLDRARAIVDLVVTEATGPVSVFVADAHGELVAAATMDGAAPDTRLNAQRKAYTAARSDARSTRELSEKARADAVERASFDPFFTFFLGGVAVFDGRAKDRRGRGERSTRRGGRAARAPRYRTICGSLKTSSSSRLRVENSEMTAPLGPARNECKVSGGTVTCSPG